MPWRWVIAGSAALLALCATIAWGVVGVREDLDTPRDLHGAPHATSGECQRCHPAQFESWHDTFHRRMTQEANEATVVGDFDDATFTYGGLDAHMRHEDGVFTIRVVGPTGEVASAEVVRTVGSRRIQQYLARDGDILYRLPVAWHVEEGRWMHMNGAFLTPDPEGLDDVVEPADFMRHVTRWNDNCVFCHNVSPNPGWQPARERYETEVAELGIACEACHGPADEHARANANPLRRYAMYLSGATDPTIVNPERLEMDARSAVCGRCHGQRITDDVGRFLERGDPYVPGDRLADYSAPLRHDTPLDGDTNAFTERFWPDGTARLTAYEYQGLLQSPCEGLGCTTCHGMHEGDPRGQLRPSHTGDGACTGCHTPDDHSHHARTECVDCHMPRAVYGVVAVHRSHRIERPDPWQTARPEACSLCHADRSEGWVQRGYARFWGSRDLREAAGDHGPRVHRDAIAGDPVARAVAVAALGRDDALIDRPRRLGVLLDVMRGDPYPAVRRIAHRALRRLAHVGADYPPTGTRAERETWVSGAAAELEVRWPDTEQTARWRAEASREAIFIGE